MVKAARGLEAATLSVISDCIPAAILFAKLREDVAFGGKPNGWN